MSNIDTYAGEKSTQIYFKELKNSKPLSSEEEYKLTRRIKEGDQVALNKLVNANLKFVISVAKNYQNQGVELSDLINEGNLGLIEAAKRFDESRDYKFISYAVWWVRQSILKCLYDTSRVVRLPMTKSTEIFNLRKAEDSISQKYGRPATLSELSKKLKLSEKETEALQKISINHLSLDSPITDNNTDNISLIDIIHDKEDKKLNINAHLIKSGLKNVLSTLSNKEAEIITLFYGIDRDYSMTLLEISEKLNLSRERIRQIKEEAIKKLQHPNRRKILENII